MTGWLDAFCHSYIPQILFLVPKVSNSWIVQNGEGKRRNEFAEWNVEWRAEWHNYAKYELRNDIIMRDTIYA